MASIKRELLKRLEALTKRILQYASLVFNLQFNESKDIFIMSEKKKKIELADFTTIKHHPRVSYDLSNNDYCIASAIFTLSHNPNSIFPGWYYGKIETLAKKFNLGRATTYRSIEKLTKKGLVERNNDTGFLRTTQLWWNDFESLRLVKKDA